jgi:hypothetical protein
VRNGALFFGDEEIMVTALQHMRRMRGGAQAHLMRCSDGFFYVVKFQNNPQHRRILVNEMLGTRLAEHVGLPVPATEVIKVDEWLVERTPELNVQLAHTTVRCAAGRQFGSRYALDPMDGSVFDYLPVEMLGRVRNLATFAGMLAMDKWTGNTDGRQAAFCRKKGGQKYKVIFIDQGYCFNAGKWTFPDDPLRGVYSRNEVYAGIKDWQSFEPWLSRIEEMPEEVVRNIAEQIPVEWSEGNSRALAHVVTELSTRRELVRGLIESFRKSPRLPFPRWMDRPKEIAISQSSCEA